MPLQEEEKMFIDAIRELNQQAYKFQASESYQRSMSEGDLLASRTQEQSSGMVVSSPQSSQHGAIISSPIGSPINSPFRSSAKSPVKSPLNILTSSPLGRSMSASEHMGSSKMDPGDALEAATAAVQAAMLVASKRNFDSFMGAGSSASSDTAFPRRSVPDHHQHHSGSNYDNNSTGDNELDHLRKQAKRMLGGEVGSSRNSSFHESSRHHSRHSKHHQHTHARTQPHLNEMELQYQQHHEGRNRDGDRAYAHSTGIDNANAVSAAANASASTSKRVCFMAVDEDSSDTSLPRAHV
jgi:hypothetical protein